MANEESSPGQPAVPPKLNLKAKVAAPQNEATQPAAEVPPAVPPPAEAKPGLSLNLAAAAGLESADNKPAEAPAAQPAAPSAPPTAPAVSGAKPLTIKPPAMAAPTGPKPLTVKPPEIAAPAAPKPIQVKPPEAAAATPATPKPLTVKPPAGATPAAPKPLAIKPPVTAAPAAPKPLGGPAAVAINPPPAAAATEDKGEDSLSQTMEIKMPTPSLAAGGPKKKETSRIPLEVAKRQTSRIPLDTAKKGDLTSGPATAEAPKTIRIKPATASQAATPASPITAKAETSNLEAAKRKTSRISLEPAMQSGSEDEGGPKTIRLKRPSEAPTIKVAKPPAAVAATAADSAAKSQTARIDMPEEEAGVDVSPTRKKTIRVKRPTSSSDDTGPKEIKPAKGSPAERAALAAANLPLGEPEPHGTFSFFAVAAIFICIACIYLFCSQAFGPNISLTQLSYGAPELDLPWPGKLGR